MGTPVAGLHYVAAVRLKSLSGSRPAGFRNVAIAQRCPDIFTKVCATVEERPFMAA